MTAPWAYFLLYDMSMINNSTWVFYILLLLSYNRRMKNLSRNFGSKKEDVSWFVDYMRLCSSHCFFWDCRPVARSMPQKRMLRPRQQMFLCRRIPLHPIKYHRKRLIYQNRLKMYPAQKIPNRSWIRLYSFPKHQDRYRQKNLLHRKQNSRSANRSQRRRRIKS